MERKAIENAEEEMAPLMNKFREIFERTKRRQNINSLIEALDNATPEEEERIARVLMALLDKDTSNE